MTIEELPSQLRPELCGIDFERTYTLAEPRFSDIDRDLTNICFIKLNPERPDRDVVTDSRDVRYKVVLQAIDGASCVCRCQRKFFFNEELYSTGGNQRGRVVYRELIVVEPDFRGRNIARSIILQEEKILFRKWKASEIQLLAAIDGSLVWTNLEFKYKIAPESLYLLREIYKAKYPQGKPSSEIGSLEDFPEEFWQYAHRNKVTFHLYKPLVRDNE